MLYALPVEGVANARQQIESLGGVVQPNPAPSIELLVRSHTITLDDLIGLLLAWNKEYFTLLDDGKRTLVEL